MGEKVYQQALWYRDLARPGYYYVPAGHYDVAMEVDTSSMKFVSDQELQTLIPYLEKDGFIKPRLDERLRVEDLKITHRLLDLLEKK